MGLDRRHPLKLAFSCRCLPRLSGLDGPSPRDRLRKRSSVETYVPIATRAAPSTSGAARDLFAAPMRSLQQETSFDMLGTRWGPRLNIARRRFFVRLKGPFLRPGQPHAKHRAQAAVNDRVSNRDAAPKASLMVASTVLKDWEA
jgi:hypothetical protein